MKRYREEHGEFLIETDENNRLCFLGYSNDTNRMNWIEGKEIWGTIRCPKGIKISVTREFTKEGNLKETYQFVNETAFPMSFKRTDVGIYTTWNDNYEDTDVCLTQKCHTHIFCGKEASYIMALQMGGNGPHLGLKVVQGSIISYSVERDLQEESNDRGDFILHPEMRMLHPNESVSISWELFWFQDKEDFFKKALVGRTFPAVRTKQCTYFVGETISFVVELGRKIEQSEVKIVCKGKEVPYLLTWNGNISTIYCTYGVQETGEYLFELEVGGKRTFALFLAYESLDKLVKSRCHFIAKKQQYHRENSPLDGAYLIYDNEEEKIYYSHLDDHNGGRERIGMGVLMACFLQKEHDETLMQSLKKYVEYVYRELYDKKTGMVYNDINRNLDWHRLYNYPWMAVFQLELYRLFHDVAYLKDSYQTMQHYYEEGGKEFYGIAIPAVDLYHALKEEELLEEAMQFKNDFVEHAEQILKNSIHYPPFEVRYEQSIVAPAVSCLLEGYELTTDEKFLREAEKQLRILNLFNGMQPDYHMYEVSIRHWDGKWFGKYRNYGDTYPHYWSALTGISYILYANVKQEEEYKEKGKASLSGCLNLFREDGRASCAMVYPETVNGEKGHYYDPWANDQDWALYFNLKYNK